MAATVIIKCLSNNVYIHKHNVHKHTQPMMTSHQTTSHIHNTQKMSVMLLSRNSSARHCWLYFIFSMRLYGIALAILSVCPSVRPSVRRVYRDKTKRCTADIFIPHEMAIALVLWHQEWLWAMPPSLRNIRQKWPTPHAKLIVPCNQYFICQDFICIWQVAIRSHYSCPAYSYGVSPCTEPLAVLTTAQWTFWTWAVARSVSYSWATCAYWRLKDESNMTHKSMT